MELLHASALIIHWSPSLFSPYRMVYRAALLVRGGGAQVDGTHHVDCVRVVVPVCVAVLGRRCKVEHIRLTVFV